MSTRTKALIVSVVITILFQALQELTFPSKWDDISYLIKGFVVSIVMFLGVFWVSNFNIQGRRFVTILFTPSYSVFILSIFLELVLFENISRVRERTFSVIFLAAFLVYNYLHILTVNILNVTSLKKIPLGQAGKASEYVFTLITLFITFLVVFSSTIGLGVKLLGVFGITFLYVYSNFWLLPFSRRDLLILVIGIALLTSGSAVILSFWPLGAELMSLYLIIFLYVLIGLGLEISDKVSVLIWIEYMFLIFFGLFLVFKLSTWGINGSIL